MMQSSGAGGKIAKIELAALTADEAAKAAAPQESPTGGKICLTLKPTKKTCNYYGTERQRGQCQQHQHKFHR